MVIEYKRTSGVTSIDTIRTVIELCLVPEIKFQGLIKMGMKLSLKKMVK